MPIDESEFEEGDKEMRDNCNDIIEVMTPRICRLESFRPNDHLLKPERLVDIVKDLTWLINRIATAPQMWFDSVENFTRNISNIAEKVSHAVYLQKKRGAFRSIQYQSILLARTVAYYIFATFRSHYKNVPLSTTMIIFSGILSGLFGAGVNECISNDDTIKYQAKKLAKAIIICFRPIIPADESIEASSLSRRGDLGYDNPFFACDENTLVWDQYYIGTILNDHLLKHKAPATKCDDILFSGLLTRTIDSLMNGISFRNSLLDPIVLKCSIHDILLLSQSLTDFVDPLNSFLMTRSTEVHLASEVVSRAVVDNIRKSYTRATRRKCSSPVCLSGNRPKSVEKPEILHSHDVPTSILSDKLEQYHVDSEVEFDRSDDLFCHLDLFQNVMSDSNGLELQKDVIVELYDLLTRELSTFMGQAVNLFQTKESRYVDVFC